MRGVVVVKAAQRDDEAVLDEIVGAETVALELAPEALGAAPHEVVVVAVDLRQGSGFGARVNLTGRHGLCCRHVGLSWFVTRPASIRWGHLPNLP